MLKRLCGLIIIFISIIIMLINKSDNIKLINEENKEIDYYFNPPKISSDTKEHYIAILNIPKIKLKKGLYNKKSHLNDVNKNIKILNESVMPNIENGNLILASHSGTSSISFFKNLDKLSINDDLIIYYEKEKYIYKLVNIYKVNKTGSIEIIRNPNRRTLSLITCDKVDKTKQVVYISELDKIESF